MKAKILVCCHKPCDYPREEPYLPIQGGKSISTIDLGIQGDDTGDNISLKNSYSRFHGCRRFYYKRFQYDYKRK